MKFEKQIKKRIDELIAEAEEASLDRNFVRSIAKMEAVKELQKCLDKDKK